MTDTSLRDTGNHLAQRLEESHADLASEWLQRLTELLAVQQREVFPSHRLLDHIPELIVEIAGYLRAPQDLEIAANTSVMAKAAELGKLRFEQRASVHQLMREYQIFAEILERFLHAEAVKLGSRVDVDQAMSSLSRATRSVRVLQQQTVDTFVECYNETIEQQTTQLRSFSRLVSHEIRQPLGVLQVLSGVFPVAPDDADAVRLKATLDRNVTRLGEVAGKLERLVRLTHYADNGPTEQLVDVVGVAGDIARQLADMASARNVQIEVDPDLPRLTLDAGRLELVLTNLLANGIKYADASKPVCVVRLQALRGRDRPTLQVIDNGIGIPCSKLGVIFEQFVRVHGHLDGALGTQGLGLGLSIVRECMDAMGGAATVESIEGHGTTFTLEWPQKTASS